MRLESISRAALVWVGLLCLPGQVLSQTADSSRTKEVQVRSADLLSVDQIDGEEVRRLVGHVVLTQETTTLRADRAIQYRQRELIVFQGGVEIVDEGDTLWADRIEYKTDTKIANGEGHVVWTDGKVELEAPTGEYQVDEKIASFSGQVVMRDSSSVITSTDGVYHVEEEMAYFTNEVRLDQESLTLLADSLTHARISGMTTASGSVRIYQLPTDSAQSRVLLLAGRAESDRDARINRLWVGPVLIRVGGGADSDTLIVAADRLEATTSDSMDAFQAVGNARMWRPDLAAIADSLAYSSHSESDSGAVVFTGSPVLWSGEAQVSGDTIRVTLVDGGPDSLVSTRSAFVAFEDSASKRIQQIKGSRLVATFRSDSLRKLVVGPQAEALYFGEQGGEEVSDDEEDESAVQFASSSIRLDFEHGDVAKIVASTDVTGEITKFQPANPPALEGFRWLAPTRPDREGLLTPELVEALMQWPNGTAEY